MTNSNCTLCLDLEWKYNLENTTVERKSPSRLPEVNRVGVSTYGNTAPELSIAFCAIWDWYKFPVVYCESVNLIGYITACYLLIVNSYASVHIVRHVWTWCNIIKQFFSTCYLTFFPFHAMRLRYIYTKIIRLLALVSTSNSQLGCGSSTICS